ncbi:hypothetical protein T4D_11336 [Trichinella pseudospiralis]|uniref:Uncharacterized protein n=1 Tax=Trichinella pseudospiralis TaxID=6337 RepID=A0A0V1FVG3_TRIPS|nr:hypothetical protein T4D_11336 [Trichinella pseudospiralis]
MLNVNLLSGSVFSPMIDIRFAVTPLTSSFGVAPFISLGIIHLKLISVKSVFSLKQQSLKYNIK